MAHLLAELPRHNLSSVMCNELQTSTTASKKRRKRRASKIKGLQKEAKALPEQEKTTTATTAAPIWIAASDTAVARGATMTDVAEEAYQAAVAVFSAKSLRPILLLSRDVSGKCLWGTRLVSEREIAFACCWVCKQLDDYA